MLPPAILECISTKETANSGRPIRIKGRRLPCGFELLSDRYPTNMVATAPIKSDSDKMMRIYNRHGEMLNEIVLEHANSSLDNEEKITYYPYPPCADNKYIYVLTKQEEEPILEVWTWNGELVERYSLDKKISNFVVSNKYHTLYAVNKDTNTLRKRPA